MFEITDLPPDEVSADLATLRSALDDYENGGVPARALDRNLLIATWNIRAFGDLTEKWESADGDSPKRDLHSLLCIAEIISRFDVIAIQEARDINSWDHNLIALGDFNIDRRGDALHDAFVSTGLEIPQDLQEAPRTIFSDPQKPELNKFYDQIAWFTGRNDLPALSLQYSRGGYFDFTRAALTTREFTKVQLSWRISDHYPLWAEFSARPG